MGLPQSPTTNHQKTTSQDHQVRIHIFLSIVWSIEKTFTLLVDQVNKMDQDFLQPIIKAMRLLCSMQLMLTYITLDPKPLRWVEEAQCPETNPVLVGAAAKAGLNPAAATLPVVAVAAVEVSINVGPAVQLNNFITAKFVKSLVPVSAKLEPIPRSISNCFQN